MLEQHSFRNKPAEFITFFLFGSCFFILAAIFLGLEFLSPCLSAMMLYLWGRRNPTVQINFLEIFHFRAPFLPWFMMLFVVMFGFNPRYDLIGVTVGHLYYYLEDVVPKIPETQDVKVLKPPRVLKSICEKL
jgi:Derlin-2/3